MFAGFMHGQAREQAVMAPPFGLRWGDSPEKLVTWSAKHAMDTTITLPGDQPGLRILKIQPQRGFLPDTKAGAVEGRFLSGRLFELTIHYFDRDASATVMEGRFEELKKQITREHGTLLTNHAGRVVEDQFVTRTESVHREPVKGLMLVLVYTEVEDLLRKTKDARFSIIYRNDNHRKEIEAELKNR